MLQAGSPALAAEPLELPEGEAWTHPHSGITVPFELGGYERSGGHAYASDFLDVGMAFDRPSRGEMVSVYIYRITNGGVPVWFAQSRGAIEGRDIYNRLELANGPVAFAPPGYAERSGLMAVWAGDNGSITSTGLALFAAGDWYVKIRVSSSRRSAASTAIWMAEVAKSLVIPEALRSGAQAAPVTDCELPLAFTGTSRDVPHDNARNAMIGMLLSAMGDAQPSQPATPVRWCREEQIAPMQVIYRPVGTDDRYLLALGDNGRAVWVGQLPAVKDLMGSLAPAGEALPYDVIYHQADKSTAFRPQDRMPTPERLVGVVDRGTPVAEVATWGDERHVKVFTTGED
ncbi:hypothetical protein [Paraurantiacibacter namhicola]|uniref:Uncharacterized protein n=1 Tax=Paraurantiacibacter namhicola TaxID=645517 RepID=A0A1C7D4Z2_9SPHN|nr:hypothetical protein [Paraurantiacibacter namhicola]ANU06538.1 hypothetical protein A6F65_00211 [Paraurantiacibacter namhicola]